jgi:hypothetical protein
MNLSAAKTVANSAGTAVFAVELGSLVTSESIKAKSARIAAYFSLTDL